MKCTQLSENMSNGNSSFLVFSKESSWSVSGWTSHHLNSPSQIWKYDTGTLWHLGNIGRLQQKSCWNFTLQELNNKKARGEHEMVVLDLFKHYQRAHNNSRKAANMVLSGLFVIHREVSGAYTIHFGWAINVIIDNCNVTIIQSSIIS